MTLGFELGLTGNQEALQERLHDVARGKLRGLAADAERDGLDPAVLGRHLQEAGIAPASLLEDGIDEPHTLLVALEELAYGDPSVASTAVPAFQAATILAACGDDAQQAAAREAWSGPSATTTVLLYEDFGRQPREYETAAVITPDGAVISGHKTSVTHPAGADLTLVVARDGDEPAAFCFSGPREGVVVERNDREAGKIALTAAPTGPVRIEGLAVAGEERLAGELALHRALGQARLLLAAVLIGLSRATLEYASAYAAERTTWGTPLAQYQGVSFPLIEQTTELTELRLLLWDVAARLGQLTNPTEIEAEVTHAVNRASSLALRASRNGVQHIGVRAITRDLPSEGWYRAAAVLAAVDFDVLATPFGVN